MLTRRSLLTGSLGSLLAAGASGPVLRWGMGPASSMLADTGPLDPTIEALLERLLRLWETEGPLPAEIASMRSMNPEWDFMGRTFTVLALACAHLRDPNPRYLPAIDRIITDTVRAEANEGMHHFLMSYSLWGQFHDPKGRSLFLDGEIAAMMGARRILQDDRWKPEFETRILAIRGSLERGPIGSAESYPNECWTFCNTFGLVALRMAEVLDGRDHSKPIRAWLSGAKRHLVDQDTGLLVSSYTWDGQVKDGPEGSSIFLSARNLQLIDPDFAADQYQRARDSLGRSVLGFGFSREWPTSWVGPMDIDSGPIVPIIEGSPSASGLMIMAAKTFGDKQTLSALIASLNLVAFPTETDGARKFALGNHVGDAVITYGLLAGPLFKEIAHKY